MNHSYPPTSSRGSYSYYYCTSCQQDKPGTEFSKTQRRIRGAQRRCISCIENKNTPYFRSNSYQTYPPQEPQHNIQTYNNNNPKPVLQPS
eukprot:UN00816